MSGIANVVLGCLWLIGGIGATTYADGNVIFYGAVIAGGIQLFAGLVQIIQAEPRPDPKAARVLAERQANVIVEAMFEMAAADGRLDEGEIYLIELYTGHLFGAPISRDRIDTMFAAYLSKLDRPAVLILSPGIARNAFIAATLVAFADGRYLDAEAETLTSIGARLGLSAEDQAGAFVDAQQLFASLLQPAPVETDLADMLFDPLPATTAGSAPPSANPA